MAYPGCFIPGMCVPETREQLGYCQDSMRKTAQTLVATPIATGMGACHTSKATYAGAACVVVQMGTSLLNNVDVQTLQVRTTSA